MYESGDVWTNTVLLLLLLRLCVHCNADSEPDLPAHGHDADFICQLNGLGAGDGQVVCETSFLHLWKERGNKRRM